MSLYPAVCFDFDYTLGDATDSIVAGFQHGLTKLGWPAPDREAVRATVGYVLEDAYTMLTGDDSPENRAKFRPLFLEVARERQREETTLFPGAVELLRGLRAQGVRLGIEPGHLLLTAFQPAGGSLAGSLGIRVFRRILHTLVKGHSDGGCQTGLDTHAFLRTDK